MRRILGGAWVVALWAGLSCSSGTPPSETNGQDLGKSCLPSAEASPDFSGFAESEVTLDHDSSCIEVCLISNFRGRVSCPYGQADPATNPSPQSCFLPMKKIDPANMVRVSVPPQLTARRPDVSVYCSCHCGAPPLCTCSSGFVCKPQLFGDSYCVKEGTEVDNPSSLAAGPPCFPAACGVPNPYGL